MAKGMKAKAVLVGLGIAAGTLFGAMAPAHADELSRTGTVESYTGTVESYTVDAKTVDTKTIDTKTIDTKTIDFKTVDYRTVAEIVDPTLAVGSYTLDATLLVGSYTLDAATAKAL